MKLGVLFSGGKDSTLAMLLARKQHEIACLISVVSENAESFMFHTPNIELTALQAQAMGIPIIQKTSKGEKELELVDLKKAIEEAKEKYQLKGIVTGAVRSTYQASRVQKICHDLKLWCFNPLWLKDQIELLNAVVKNKIVAVIGGVFAEPLDETYLGEKIDRKMIKKLEQVMVSHQINPAGEGGEIETTVIDCTLFKKKIEIEKFEKKYNNYSGTFKIIKTKLVNK